jgi:hypothetical protein
MPARTLIGLALLFAGCNAEVQGHSGTQVGDEGWESGWGCAEVSREAIDDPSAVAEGFTQSPDERWAGAEGLTRGTFQLEEDGTAPMTVDVVASGGWELVRSEEPPPSGGAEPAIYFACPDAYERTATISIVVDGHFNEVVEDTIRLYDDGSDAFYLQIDLDDLEGSARPLRFDAAAMDKVWLSWSASGPAGEGGWSGEASFQGERSAGDGPSDPVSLTNDPYGSFHTSAPGDTGL